MAELGTGYISILPETSKLASGISSAMSGPVSSEVEKAGPGIGTRLASGIGKTLKVGAVTAGTTAGAALGISLTKGIGRLTGIENAQAKLSGLGHDGQAVAGIMDNALNSVRGTAFGLEDAATIAASAVAAGVQPGQDLERTLKLTADAATIAGSSLSEMGDIFGKVAASNKLQGDTIAQLHQRGIPIVQMLADSLGKTTDEVIKLASQGKISFADFQNAMEQGLGGAALKAGDTVTGSFANMGAAAGRLGATLAGPFFRQAAGTFTGITDAVDSMNARIGPGMDRFEQNLTGKYIPALQNFGRAGVDAFQEFRDSDLVVSSLSRLSGIFESLWGTAQELGPSLKTIGSSLADAAAATGVSAWQVLLSTLEAVAPIVDATLVPALRTLANLMESNQSAVNALAIGWLAFRTVPALITPVIAAKQKLTAQVTAASGAVTRFNQQMAVQASLASAAGTAVGRYGAAVATLNARLGTAAGSMGLLRSAGSGLMGLMGGPWVAGLMAAGAAAINFSSGLQRANQQQELLSQSAANAAGRTAALWESMSTSTGNSLDTMTQNLKDFNQEQQQLAATGPSFMQQHVARIDDVAKHFSIARTAAATFGVTLGSFSDGVASQKEVADAAAEVARQMEAVGMSSEQMAKHVQGSQRAFDAFVGNLRGAGFNELADEMVRMRQQYEGFERSLERIGPGGAKLAEGLREIAGAADDSAARLGGLRSALEALGLIETSAEQAAWDFARAVTRIGESAGSAADPMGAFGDALFDSDEKLDRMVPNAQALKSELDTLAEGFLKSVNAGNDAAAEYAAMQGSLQALADAYDVPIEKIRELIGGLGAVPDVVTTLLVPEGADETRQKIAAVVAELSLIPDGETKTTKIHVDTDEAIQGLRDAGFEVKELERHADGGGIDIQVTASSDLALAAIDRLNKELNTLDGSEATAELDLETTRFAAAEGDARNKLAALDTETASPEVDLLMQKFLDGHGLTVRELNALSAMVADPEVILLIQQALSDAAVVNSAIDNAARDRTATIRVVTEGPLSSPGAGGNMLSRYASGSRLPRNADGGRLPTSGPGTDTTDGILAVSRVSGTPVSWVDGGEWVVNRRSSAKHDRLLAAINRDDPMLRMLPAFADGGRLGAVKPPPAMPQSPAAPVPGGGVHFHGPVNTQNIPELVAIQQRAQRRAARRVTMGARRS